MNECPSCAAPVTVAQTFCANCGELVLQPGKPKPVTSTAGTTFGAAPVGALDAVEELQARPGATIYGAAPSGELGHGTEEELQPTQPMPAVGGTQVWEPGALVDGGEGFVPAMPSAATGTQVWGAGAASQQTEGPGRTSRAAATGTQVWGAGAEAAGAADFEPALAPPNESVGWAKEVASPEPEGFELSARTSPVPASRAPARPAETLLPEPRLFAPAPVPTPPRDVRSTREFAVPPTVRRDAESAFLAGHRRGFKRELTGTRMGSPSPWLWWACALGLGVLGAVLAFQL